MSLSSIPKRLRTTVLARDGGRCQYCGLKQVGQAAVFHVDHIFPRSRGGETTLENLALQCPSCSLHKSDRIEGTDPDTQEMVPLFHPLHDKWPEHFSISRNGACLGKSAVGRATVVVLRMNDELPRTARGIQILLGIVPL